VQALAGILPSHQTAGALLPAGMKGGFDMADKKPAERTEFGEEINKDKKPSNNPK